MSDQPSRTSETRAVVERLYDACVRGRLGKILACMADDIVIHEPAMLPYGGTYRGHDEVRRLLMTIGTYIDTGRFAVDRLVVDDDVAFGLLRIPDPKTGGDVQFAEQVTVSAGRVVEIRIFVFDRQSLTGNPG